MISIIIPCRNEEKFIGRCLDSVIKQDYPKEDMEILVVNGASQDKTEEIIDDFAGKYPFIKLLENPRKFTPFGLNIGIKTVKGDIIIRMDAHALYEKDYISKCVEHLKESGAENVGGAIETLPADETLTAKAIAFSLSHPLGVASLFRLGSQKPIEVDTVFGGCYKKEIFQKMGSFNEKLIRSQDLEFNLRLRKAGGKILLFPDIVAHYYASANFKDFAKHNFSDGLWVTYPLRFKIKAFSLRHFIPLLFVLSVILSFSLSLILEHFFLLFLFIVIFYSLTILFFSFKIAEKEKDLRYLFLMPVAFFCRHFIYGLGSIVGLFKTVF